MAVVQREDLDTEAAVENRIFHGMRPKSAVGGFTPPLTIALNRQTGARGRAVAERVAELLDFTFVNPESLELAAQDPVAQMGLDDLPEDAHEWFELRLAELAASSPVGTHPEMLALVRVVLELGALGRSVMLGKGASAILPPESTLNVRLVAPEADRIAYIAQWERFSANEAASHVHDREEARREYMLGKFGVDPEPVGQYAMVLNTSELGVETCAQLIAVAARARCGDAD